jgi:N-methylhydantoinase A/oxoprolinase/acetone carboxylase beta subunit
MSNTPPTPLLLGVDTGGTFTDAVLFDEETATVVAAAKAPTTHDDISVGVGAAIDAVLAGPTVHPSQIELVSLSTTLATNALVEGLGRPIAAVVIGFDAEVVERAGLGDALGDDPIITVPGGHDSHGVECAALPLSKIERELRAVADRVDAVAVMAQFSVRNPAHERAVARLVRDTIGLPATCSCDLSAQLNGPKRAVTAVLNARLIALIDELVVATQTLMTMRGIEAPLMAVRGDGSLVSAAFVRERPIETILSGPAASVVGASFLTGCADAIVVDIGGTTTDVGLIRHGVPAISSDGASVGGHETMVPAVAITTVGLGGDSHVMIDDRSALPTVRVGPRRVIPVCAAAAAHPAFVHDMLDRHLRHEPPRALDGVAVMHGAARRSGPTDPAEGDLLAAITGPIADAAALAVHSSRRRALDRLVQKGLLQLVSFTPTDACHVLGTADEFDASAARKAAQLMARQRTRFGRPVAAGPEDIAALTLAALTERSADTVLGTALAADGFDRSLARSPLVRQSSADQSDCAVEVVVRPALPMVGIGASSAVHHPPVAARLGIELIVPRHAAVASAVGAVVGGVRLAAECAVTSPERGVYLLHADGEPVRFERIGAARDAAERHLQARLGDQMLAAGASTFDLDFSWSEHRVEVEGGQLFVSGRVAAVARGRPARRR